MLSGLLITATDPVCGRLVRIARVAAVVDHGGFTYYFCSDACGRTFAAAPEQFGADFHGGDSHPSAA